MPILNADQAHSVLVLKRSLAAGFAGEDNGLFSEQKTMMIFGDAKATRTGILHYITQMAPRPSGYGPLQRREVSVPIGSQ